MKLIVQVMTFCAFLFFATDAMAQSPCKSTSVPNKAKKDCRQKSCKECLQGYIWVNPTKRKDGTLVCGYCRKATTTKNKKKVTPKNKKKVTPKKKSTTTKKKS